MRKLEPQPDLCEHLEVHELVVPKIEIYKCKQPKGCEHAVPFAEYYCCRLAYDTEPEKTD